MRVLILAAIVAAILGTTFAGGFFYENRPDSTILLDNFRRSPSETTLRIDAAISECLPPLGVNPEFDAKGRKLLSQLYIYVLDLRTRESNKEKIRAQIGIWITDNARNIVAEIEEKDFLKLLNQVRKSADAHVLNCVVSHSV